MGIENYFEFGSALVDSNFRARGIGLKGKDDRDLLGDSLRLVLGDYGSISFPIVFRQYAGKTLNDVLDTGRSALYLISERMRSTLEKNNLTGWKTFPIRLLDQNGRVIEGYFGLSITGRCGPIDISKSKPIEKRIVPNGPVYTYHKGLYIGLDEWDGSDFFLPRHNYGTMVSSEAADVLKSNKLTNISLRNLADIEISDETAELIRSKNV